ncbi:MAG TPA: hypothetical protein VJR27_00950 [Candidatus Saccharimonadales bacterium]|nr:hypothetical protein [Candidatus Saccharimonadales bacterium]
MAFEIFRDKSLEEAHRPHFEDRHASKELTGRAIILDYPELLGAPVDERDLTNPEYLASDTSVNADPHRGTAPVAGMIATVPTTEIEMPSHLASQPPVNEAGYEPAR